MASGAVPPGLRAHGSALADGAADRPMKRRGNVNRWLRMLGLGLVLAIGGTVSAQTTVGATVSGVSNYLWRGYDLGPAGLFSDLTLTTPLQGHFSLTGYVWNYYQIDRGWRPGETDFDISVGYAPAGCPASFTAGWIYYGPQNHIGPHSREVYFGADFDTFLSPSIFGYYDYDAATGLYVLLQAGHSFGLSSRLTLDLGGSLGLDSGRITGTFNDFGLSAGLTYTLSSEWSIIAGANLVVPSEKVAGYGARAVPSLGIAYSSAF